MEHDAHERRWVTAARRPRSAHREHARADPPTSPTPPTAPPKPPYYAVIFTSLRTAGDNGYGRRADEMVRLAADMPGFLGIDSARGADGLGISVSYWRDEASIAAWRNQPDHSTTRKDGRAHWYETFTVHVAKVERSYDFHRVGD